MDTNIDLVKVHDDGGFEGDAENDEKDNDAGQNKL